VQHTHTHNLPTNHTKTKKVQEVEAYFTCWELHQRDSLAGKTLYLTTRLGKGFGPRDYQRDMDEEEEFSLSDSDEEVNYQIWKFLLLFI